MGNGVRRCNQPLPPLQRKSAGPRLQRLRLPAADCMWEVGVVSNHRGGLLYAFVIVWSHYHLAVDTPEETSSQACSGAGDLRSSILRPRLEETQRNFLSLTTSGSRAKNKTDVLLLRLTAPAPDKRCSKTFRSRHPR